MPRSHILCRSALVRRTVALILLSAVAVARTPAQAPPLRVFFVGNSYTYVNGLPAMVAWMATEAHEPRRFDPSGILIGGYTLEHHIADDSVPRRIERGGPWDYVVLQEQSDRPVTAPALLWRDVQRLAGAVKGAGGKVLLYETWAKEKTPELQDSLSRSYHHAAELSGATVVHVGEAWAAFRATEVVAPGAHSVLFAADGSHPAPAGTYLAACVFYATIYGKSPVGLPAGPVPATLAKELQAIAWKAARR